MDRRDDGQSGNSYRQIANSLTKAKALKRNATNKKQYKIK